MLPENSNIILAAARMRAKCSNKTPSLAVSQQRWLGPSYEQKKVYDTLGRPMVSIGKCFDPEKRGCLRPGLKPTKRFTEEIRDGSWLAFTRNSICEPAGNAYDVISYKGARV